MPGLQETLVIDDCQVLVLGTIPGFGPDGERVATAIRDHNPDTIAVGVPQEDLEALDILAEKPELIDNLDSDEMDELFLDIIAKWGAVEAVPSPDLAAARASGLPLQPVDMSDEIHTDLFTATVKVRHLVQRSGIRKRLRKATWTDSADAYEVALMWDAALGEIKPLRGVELAREDAMATNIRKLCSEKDRLLVVVHAARAPGLMSRLSA